jgi:hypothetical protein
VNGEWTESLCKVNAGWVSVQPYAFSYPNQSEVHYNGNRQWWGERTEGAAELVRQAHQNNIKVMLKPMVWVPGGWVGSYAMKTEDAWVAWEKSYTAYILENAALAQKEGVELFCIGTEFNEAVIQRPKFWPRLVADVRKVYSGPVTYAANWDNYKLVKFWDVLDYMGVDAYFPLSPKTIPNVAELKKLWSEPAREIELMHRYYKKPVLFTEFGYRSIDACSWKHWEQEHIPNNQQVNLKAQVNAYRAFLSTIGTWIGLRVFSFGNGTRTTRVLEAKTTPTLRHKTSPPAKRFVPGSVADRKGIKKDRTVWETVLFNQSTSYAKTCLAYL